MEKITWKQKIDMASAFSGKPLGDIAEKIGMTRQTLNSRLEKNYISRDEAYALAEYFGVTIEWVQRYPDKTVDLFVIFPDGTRI